MFALVAESPNSTGKAFTHNTATGAIRSALYCQATRQQQAQNMLRTVAARWAGSNEHIATFDFDFDQVGAPWKLQSQVATCIENKDVEPEIVKVCCSRTGRELTHSLPCLNKHATYSDDYSNADTVDYFDRLLQERKSVARKRAWVLLKQSIASASSPDRQVVAVTVTLASKTDSLIATLLLSKHSRLTFENMHETDRANYSVALAALRMHRLVLGSVPLCLLHNLDFLAEVYRSVPQFSVCSYWDLFQQFANDRTWMMFMCSWEGDLLQHASESIKADRDVVEVALVQSLAAYWCMTPELRNDRRLFAAAVYSHRANKTDSSITKQLVYQLLGVNDGHEQSTQHVNLKDDRQAILAAVKICGQALVWASHTLRDDCEVVFAAVQVCGKALQYASPRLKNDRLVVLEAVQNDGTALAHASAVLQDDYDVVLAAVQQNANALLKASTKIRSDRRILLETKGKKMTCVAGLFSAHEVLCEDFDVVLVTVQHDGRNLFEASDALCNDRRIVLAAVQQHGLALRYAHPNLQKDFDVVLAAVKQNGKALGLVDDRNVAVMWDQFMSDDRVSNYELVAAAVENDGTALEYASQDLQQNVAIATAACKQTLRALRFVDETIKAQVMEIVM